MSHLLPIQGTYAQYREASMLAQWETERTHMQDQLRQHEEVTRIQASQIRALEAEIAQLQWALLHPHRAHAVTPFTPNALGLIFDGATSVDVGGDVGSDVGHMPHQSQARPLGSIVLPIANIDED